MVCFLRAGFARLSAAAQWGARGEKRAKNAPGLAPKPLKIFAPKATVTMIAKISMSVRHMRICVTTVDVATQLGHFPVGVIRDMLWMRMESNVPVRKSFCLFLNCKLV